MKRFYLLFALLVAFSFSGFSQGYVATVPPLAGGNGNSGVSFNLATTQTIQLDTFFCTFTGTGVTQIWYNTTPINGAPTISTANGWVQIGGNIPIATATTNGNVVPIPQAVGLIMPAGSNWGFYIAGSGITGGAGLSYTNGTVGSASPYTDGTVTIECGTNVGYGGPIPGPLGFHVRQFNGGLSYTILGGANDAAVLSVDSPEVFCAGVKNVIATIGNYGANQIDSVDVNWEVAGVAQPSFKFIGLLDTLNGTFPQTAQVTLGTYNFAAGTTNIRVWTSNPNGMSDTSNYNDTANVNVTTASPPSPATILSAGLTQANATLGNVSGIDYVVVPFGAPAASGTPVSNVSSPFNITGLTQSTTYDLYVRTNCGGGNVSAWVGPTTFNTAYGVPFFQDFENYTSGLQGATFPEGWSQRQGTGGYNLWRSQLANGNNTNSGGTGPLWDHTFFGGPTGGLYMYMETSTSNTGDTVELYSPPIYIDSVLSTVELGYWYFNFGTNIDKMEVLVDSNGTRNLLATYTGAQQAAQTDPWLFASHFLNGYDGKSVQLIFRGYGVPCCSGDIAVDDISLDPVLALDAGVTDVISPSGSLCPGNVTPIIEVRNFGSTQLDSVKVYWDINGTLDSMTYVGTMAPGSFTNISLPVQNIMAGTIYNIDFYTGDVNGQADQFPGNNMLSLTGLRTGLNGTVTVDPALPASGTNFIDFASLTNTLNNYGVCGTAVVNIANGTYSTPLILDNVPGLDANNTLTIDGGDSSLTIISHDGSTNFSTVLLDGVDYVTLTNLTIECSAALNGAAVLMTGGTDYNTISNCIVRMNTATTSFNSAAITISGSSTSATQTPSQHAVHNTFENNVILGGYYGVRIYGDFNTINGVSNRIINNDIDSAWYYGAYVYYQDSAEVVNNTIQMNSRGNIQADAVYMFYNNNGKINGNYLWAPDWTVYWTNTSTLVQPLLYRRNEMINNMVYSSGDYGVYMNGVDSLDFWYNSVNSESSSTPALYINTFGNYFLNDWDLRNNILQSAGSAALDINGTTDSIFNKMDNNVYNTVNGGVLIDINGTTYANLAAYQTAQPLLNSSSLEGDPQFASATDLHIIGAFINDSADASVPVMVDIDGDTRPATGAAGPDPGADEYDPPTCPPAANLNAYDQGLDSATIAWSTTAVGVSFEYVVVLGGAPQSSGTPVITVVDTARLGGLTASTRYDFYVRVICGRGDTSQWIGPSSFNTANGIPYFQDFETWGNPNFTGLINEEGWYTQGTPTPNWQVNSTTGSFATGPIEDHTIGVGGTFVYLETSGGTTGNTDTLWSAPIYFAPNQNAVTLEYWYHMHGAAMGTLEVYVLANGVLSPVLSTFTGQQHVGQADPWLAATANVGGQGGNTVQLVFVGIRGTSFTSDMAIDDVRLFIPPPTDGGVTDIISPASGCGLGVDSVEIEITNFGTGSLSNFPVQYSLNGGAPVVETFTGTIASGATATHVFATTVNLSTAGSYTLAAQTNITNDGDITNDADTAFIESIPLVGSPATTLYVEDFEGGIGGWVPSGTLWQRGTPTGTVIGTTGSGTNSYVTNLAGNYPNGANAYLQGPCFDFTGAANPAIEFQINWDTEAGWDGGFLESSIDGGQTWQKVGDVGTGNNWYTGNANAVGGNAWAGNSGGWIVASHGLDSLVGQSSVLLRFGFQSDGSVNGFDGIGIDSIMVYNNVNVGIEDQVSTIPSFSLSPNPSNGEFMLNINSEKTELIQLSIRDMEGKLVHNEQLNVNGNFNKSMDLGHLSKGVYFLRLQNDNESKIEKLIIQ